ncbi:class III extradiol ring-cleavage dioxygenase [Trebonia sp.]|uniref:dioxygenase family protein n=1 Tax=Trebonia sp. TaxID=2767075 RepID=UPI00261E9B37|nr:class III extradiol ring-cleavage dioxygenase [Trebonia sp.]
MHSIFDPLVPAGAYDEFAKSAGPASADHRAWTEGDGPLPALFIGHGAPPLLDDPEWMIQLAAWTHQLPKPKSVLIVSAHWETAPLMLSAPAAGTPLVYDFAGFQPRYYTLTYPTPDASALAAQVRKLMADTQPAHQHPSRGLDHGAWVPLKVMYPLADVPVLQLSIPTQNPARLLSLGERLRPLRESGVLIIGSGFLTHGLPFLTRDDFTAGHVPGWSADFDLWAADALERGDVETLAGFRKAPGMPYAHPTADHFLPLFVTLGAAEDPGKPVDTVIDGYWMGLAKRSFQVS